MSDVFTVSIKEKKQNMFVQLVEQSYPVTDIVLQFAEDCDEVIELTAVADMALTYRRETLTNVASVEYKINDVVSTLPFALVVGDVLTVTITRTTLADSKIVLQN